MAADEKKPSLAMAMAKKPEPAEEEAEESSEDYSAAAGELFDALKSDDRAGFATALKAAVMSCK